MNECLVTGLSASCCFVTDKRRKNEELCRYPRRRRGQKNEIRQTENIVGGARQTVLCWVMSALRKAGIDDICVVKGFKKECVEEYLSTLDFSVESVFQAERLGTGHAVMMAKDFLKKHSGNVVILNGDAPFMDSKTIEDSLKAHIENGCAATVISAKVDDPTGYGRIVRDENGNLRAIVEQKDADEETLKINEVNSGGFWFDCQLLLSVLDRIKRITAQRNIIFPTQSSFCLRTEERSEHYGSVQ